MATPKYTKIDERFGIIEYPVTLAEMVEISKELPKTERTYYKYAFDALKKVMKAKEAIYCFEVANPKLTKMGFMVVGEHNLYLVMMKGGFFGGAEAEVIKYKDIKKRRLRYCSKFIWLIQCEYRCYLLRNKENAGYKKEDD